MRESRIISPRLPYPTRIRLRAERRIDGLAARLVEAQHHRAALWLWRICRML